jgi:hypothetical protein
MIPSMSSHTNQSDCNPTQLICLICFIGHPMANSKGTRFGDEIFKGRRGRTRLFVP